MRRLTVLACLVLASASISAQIKKGSYLLPLYSQFQSTWNETVFFNPSTGQNQNSEFISNSLSVSITPSYFIKDNLSIGIFLGHTSDKYGTKDFQVDYNYSYSLGVGVSKYYFLEEWLAIEGFVEATYSTSNRYREDVYLDVTGPRSVSNGVNGFIGANVLLLHPKGRIGALVGIGSISYSTSKRDADDAIRNNSFRANLNFLNGGSFGLVWFFKNDR